MAYGIWTGTVTELGQGRRLCVLIRRLGDGFQLSENGIKNKIEVTGIIYKNPRIYYFISHFPGSLSCLILVTGQIVR